MRFAYADPPYYGNGKKRYGDKHPEAAVWDKKEAHIDLVRQLVRDFPDGWALSCNPSDLRWLLPECPEDVRVCVYAKTFAQIYPSSIQYHWEPLIVWRGRKKKRRNPLVKDWIATAANVRLGLVGAKPPAFSRWMFQLLGADPGDELVDLFPGSGAVSKEWDRFQKAAIQKVLA